MGSDPSGDRPRPAKGAALAGASRMRPAAGCVKVEATPDAGLQFSRVRAAGETQWLVHRAGRFIGAIAERDGGFHATRLIEGALRTRHFPDRDAAAWWLVKLVDG